MKEKRIKPLYEAVKKTINNARLKKKSPLEDGDTPPELSPPYTRKIMNALDYIALAGIVIAAIGYGVYRGVQTARPVVEPAIDNVCQYCTDTYYTLEEAVQNLI
jgi:hypothetical protein